MNSLQRLLETTTQHMQQFGASIFYVVAHCHKLSEVENECTLHNLVVLAINRRKIIKVSKNLTKL